MTSQDGGVNRTLGQSGDLGSGVWVWMVGAKLLWERGRRGLGRG